MKKILFFIIIFLFTSFAGSMVYAADLNINCSGSGTCTKSGTDPIFDSSDGRWSPGRTLTKTLNLKNSTGGVKTIALLAKKSSGELSTGDIFHINIRKIGDSTSIWDGKMSDFLTQDKISFGSFSDGEARDYYFTVSMDKLFTNTSQNLSIGFDLTVGIWEEGSASSSSTSSTSSPTNTPAPAPTNTPTPTSVTATLRVGTALQEATEPSVTPTGAVLGTESGLAPVSEAVGGLRSFCASPLWALVLFSFEFMMTAVFVIFGKKLHAVRHLLFQGLLTLVSLFIAGTIFCQGWVILGAGLIGVAGIIMLIT